MDNRNATGLMVAAAIVAIAIPDAHGDEHVTIAVTTSRTQEGKYEPRNVVAIWIEDASGKFIRTLVRFGVRRVKYLRAWNAVSLDRGQIGSDPDVITGATRSNHGQLMVGWDLTDFHGVLVPDGTYSIRMELADSNADTPSDNNEGVFTFEKNGTTSQVTDLSSGGFSAGRIEYSSVSDPTDPPGSDAGVDPVDPFDMCPPSADCRDDDGCCLPDCVYEVDNDCDPSTARESGTGCSAGSGGANGWSIAILVALALLAQASFRKPR